MKLDVNVLRYLSKEDWRVLTSVEMGQKNHELVPIQLIDSISGLKHGGAYRCLKTLLQHKLVHHEGHKYDGYRLTYMGYDFLAIRALVARGHIAGVGRQIGVGKESDIFEVTNDEGEVFALKLHRLGRTSFRDVKSKRDYLGGRSSFSWLYLSRLAALKEYAFMKALGDHGFPVPVAIDSNRHAVLMELLDAQPLVQVRELGNPRRVYEQAMGLIERLAGRGLIHCDFNEFNLMVDEDEQLTLIDFPQMVSVSHANAAELFDRDVDCIIRFFSKKIGYVPQADPQLGRLRPRFADAAAPALAGGAAGLDVELAASGFKAAHQAALEQFAAGGGGGGEGECGGCEGEEPGAPSSSGSGEAPGSDASTSTGDEQEQQQQQQPHAGPGPRSSEEQQQVGRLGQQLAGLQAGPGPSSSSSRGDDRRPQVSASTQRWLEQHVGEPGAAAGSAAESPCDSCSSSGSGGRGSEQDGSEAGSSEAEAPAPPVGAGARPQQRAGRGWEGSVAPSRAATDVSLMGREVQQRLVAQRQKAAARAAAAKAGRNVSKARGKKARATAAALAEW